MNNNKVLTCKREHMHVKIRINTKKLYIPTIIRPRGSAKAYPSTWEKGLSCCCFRGKGLVVVVLGAQQNQIVLPV